MSSAPLDSNNTSPPTKVRTKAVSDAPSLNDTPTSTLSTSAFPLSSAPTLKDDEVTPEFLFRAGRSKTAPAAQEKSWTASDTISRNGDMPSIATENQQDQQLPTSDGTDQDTRRETTNNGTQRSTEVEGSVARYAGDVKEAQSVSPTVQQPVFSALSFQKKIADDIRNLRDRAHNDPYELSEDTSKTGNGTRMGGHKSDRILDADMIMLHLPSRYRSQTYNSDFASNDIDQGARARYRSWREGNASISGPVLSGNLRSRSGDNLHGDNKIRATLPKSDTAGTTARSRKSSQYLGLFKEKDSPEEQRRREGKAKEWAADEGTSPVHANIPNPLVEDLKGTVPTVGVSKIRTLFAENQETVEDPAIHAYDTQTVRKQADVSIPNDLGSGSNTAPRAEDRQRGPAKAVSPGLKSVSSRTAGEIRKEHEIELNSDSERLLSGRRADRRAERDRQRVNISSLITKAPVEEPATYLPDDRDHGSLHSPGTGDDDDEESEREHISSALYFPHRQVVAGSEIDMEAAVEAGFLSSRNAWDVRKESFIQGHLAPVAEEQPSTSNNFQISELEMEIMTNDEKQLLHSDISSPVAAPSESVTGYASSQGYGRLSETEYDTHDSSRSTFSYDSSSEEDLGTTPVAPHRQNSSRTHHDHYNSRAPLGAVELKPFDHQVGGHSTVYRFSRRAVCKQLNNRENEFYETVEREHPELLEFLPRYIGVLNVTYRKARKRKRIQSSSTKQSRSGRAGQSASAESRSNGAECSGEDAFRSNQASPRQSAPIMPRVVSHSHSSQPMSIPQVVLENNRHIIPNNLFRNRARPVLSERATTSYSTAFKADRRALVGDRNHAGQVNDNQHDDDPPRPIMKQQQSWGATTVNTNFQEQVLREVFAPPQIHRHRRRERNRHGLSKTALLPDSQSISGSAPTTRRGSADVSARQSVSSQARDSVRKRIKDSEVERHPASMSSPSNTQDLTPPSSADCEPQHEDSGALDTDTRASTDANRMPRRRHSGGGLHRRIFDLESGRRSNLEFHEEDEYGGGGESEVFEMDDEAMLPVSFYDSTRASQLDSAPQNPTDPPQAQPQGISTSMLPASAIKSGESECLETHHIDQERMDGMEQAKGPCNPKQAQVDKDHRAELFILLEDLTAGMSNPCVLDLKMGTRQYGVEANEKKQRSQRRKCQKTTSVALGVRVCGMQVWNVKTQSYLFEDKYFGRELHVGSEFQDALTRYFFDGVGHSSAIKHIPTILEKISLLERMILRLPGYRFYASSLLMLYDRGATEDLRPMDKVSQVGEDVGSTKHADELQKQPEIKFKIVDFANCVTAEDPLPPGVPCPPSNPAGVDRGYLRGLRSLRRYFQNIWKEVKGEEWIEGAASLQSPLDRDAEIDDEEYSGNVSV